jgi:UDP-glucose 4-epimerase
MTSPLLQTPARFAALVTGGAGFLGRSLVESLASNAQHVTVVDDADLDLALDPVRVAQGSTRHVRADMRFLADVMAPSAQRRFDAVVHLAGIVGVRRVLAEPEGCRRANEDLGRALLAWIAGLEADARPRVFAASTSEVYRASRRPLHESDAVHPIGAERRWAYAASKIACERALDAARLWPIERAPVHLRFFNVVGPGQDSSQGMMLPTFVEQALAGRPITVHGDGSQVRTLAHVDDVAATLRALIAHPRLPGGPLNIGGTARASVLEIARCVEALSKSRAGIVHVDPLRTVGSNFEDIAWREPDLSKLRALGVPVPARSLEDIVADTLARHTELVVRRHACASRAS